MMHKMNPNWKIILNMWMTEELNMNDSLRNVVDS